MAKVVTNTSYWQLIEVLTQLEEKTTYSMIAPNYLIAKHIGKSTNKSKIIL